MASFALVAASGAKPALRMAESLQVRVPDRQPTCLSRNSHIHARSSPGEGSRFLPSSKDSIQRGHSPGVPPGGGREEDVSCPERDGRKEGGERLSAGKISARAGGKRSESPVDARPRRRDTHP